MSRYRAGGRSLTRDLGILVIVMGTLVVWGVGPSLFVGWSQASAPALPELHPISLVLNPASPVDKGVAVVARAKIVNTGDSAASRFSIEFFYRLKSDPARPWLSFPDGKGLVTLPQGLSPRDQAITVEGTLDTAKAEIEPGSYEIRVLVDSGNQISEHDETNNDLVVGLQVRPSRLTKPDLVPTALVFNPPSPIDSQTTVTVIATVRNSGPVDAGPFEVQYLFCKLPTPRGTCPPDQLVEFARAAVPTGLKAGEERSGRDLHGQEIQFPSPKDPSMAKLDPGTYLIQVRIDPTSKEQPTGTIEEQDEANNSLTALLTVKGPELFPESIVLTPTPVRAGDEVLVTAQIANAGAAPAENVPVAFFVDGRRFALVETSLPAAEQTGATVTPARATVQVSLKTAELALAPGVHELRVVVDPDDRVSELDESNNALTTALTLLAALPQLPELAPKSLIVTPASPIEQGQGTVTAEIINTGTRPAEGFDVEFSVREAGRLRWNPISCIANCVNNKLNPNGELTAQAQLPVLAPGSYEVRVVIDPQRRIQESDKENNEMVTRFRVITPRKPDLALTQLAFDPASLTAYPGQPVRILFTIENIGDAPVGPSEAQCAYRRLEDFAAPPTIFEQVSVPALVPGERVTKECRASITRPGFYELTVTLDPRNAIDEQNEANNVATSGTGIPGQPGQGQALLILGPDLVPVAATLTVRRPKTTPTIAPPPSLTVTQGEVLELEVTIRNTGAVAAGGFEVAFCIREYFSDQACTEIGTRSRATGLGLADEFVARTQLPTEILAPKIYEIGVIVDPPTTDQPFGRVEEVSERNNFIGGPRAPRGVQLGVLGKPDLTFREPLVFQPTGPIPVGTKLGVFVDVQNLGAGPTTREFSVEFAFRRVEDPGQPPTEFRVFATATIAELEVGPEKAKQVKAELDTSTLAPGIYEIQVTLDSGNLIPELNETNNRAVARVAIGTPIGLVDLAVQAVSLFPNQAIVSRGQIVRVSAVIANLGTAPSGPFVVEFSYRNLLSSPATDPVFSRQTIANLDGSARTTITASLNTISLSPGTYEIAVTVDPENRISEPDETNNRLVIFLTVN
ncbi:MAG: hypothetical protein N3E42_01905 [Candidatus Bipolaricaulota bacterium]|nr:hypothetical protein [Candidatus Bipolaricaulota bacterium]